jgi:hypothetical protein
LRKDALLNVFLFAALAVCGAAALGVDFTAAYPPGDGGLFYAICRQLEAAHFVYPGAIDYNGSSIPFAYSPGAFYIVALLRSLTHLPLGGAMNLWVGAWAFALGPAAYWASRQILPSRLAAFASALYAVLVMHSFEYLGMGGGLTRSPGLCFLMLASGAMWRLKTRYSRANVCLAAALCAGCGWAHMEFFLLLVIGGIIIAIANRLSIAKIATLSGLTAVLLLPWPIAVALRGTLPAMAVALHTAHGAGDFSILWFFVNVAGNPFESPVAGLGVAALIVAIARREFVWPVWALVIALVDSRAGPQVDHFVVGLAVGSAVAALERMSLDVQWSRALIATAVAIGIAAAGADTVFAQQCVRISQTDVDDMTWLKDHTPARAAIVVAFADTGGAAPTDQTYEWLPVFAQRWSATAFEGLEWVSLSRYRRMSNSLLYVQTYCGHIGVPCLEQFARARIEPHRPWYVYLPYHSEYASLLREEIERSGSFETVHVSASGAIFAALPGRTAVRRSLRLS